VRSERPWGDPGGAPSRFRAVDDADLRTAGSVTAACGQPHL